MTSSNKFPVVPTPTSTSAPAAIQQHGIPAFASMMQAAASLATKLTPLTVAQADSIFAINPVSRTKLDINEGMHVIVDKCIAGLANTGLVFDRGSILVCIDRDDSIHTFTKSTVTFALSRLFEFVKTVWNPQAKQLIEQPAAIPGYLGDTIVSLTKWDEMPIVDALSDHPVITPDNRLLAPGFDKATRVFTRYNHANYSITDAPTKEDAAEALIFIRRLLQTFDFEGAADEAAALAMLFTAVARPALLTALFTLITASMPGSGKGYMATIACWLAKASEPVARQLQDDKTEMHKALMSILQSAQAVCFFDEVDMHDIDMPCLRTFVTAPIYGGRCLGYIHDIYFPNRTFSSATGNNMGPTQDFARRTLIMSLNPRCENPSLRKFNYECDDPSIKSAHADVKRNREKFISAILTIQRAFLLAQERGEGVTLDHKLGGFDDWETMCRLPIIWLTNVDPSAKAIIAMSENAAKDELGAVMAAWLDAFGNAPITPTQAMGHEMFGLACHENIKRRPGSQINNITLSLWLKRHKGQIVQNRMFYSSHKDPATKAHYWLVMDVV